MKILFISLPKNIAESAPLTPSFRSPPITHLWLASILMKGGHEVSILDALSLNMGRDEILNAVKRERPDIVGFTVFTNAFFDVMFMAETIKESFPSVRIAVGGYHVNSRPKDFYSDCIDFVFSGEGEKSLLALMDGMESGSPSPIGVAGVAYQDGKSGDWIENPPGTFIKSFDDIPVLPYEMILGNAYNTWWTVINPRKYKYMATVTGKGCPMNCSFCDISKTEGLRYRSMSAARVLEELRHMRRGLGITHIEFRDPFFTVDRNRLELIAEGILRNGLDIEWGCSSTVQRMKDPQLLKLLRRSGCRFIFYGVESGDPEILKREKKVTPEQVHDVIRKTKEADIQTHCSFIFGLEGETEQTMRRTMDMALRLDPHTASFSIAVPYPGTAIFDSYSGKGYIKTCDWRLYGGEEPVFETESVSGEMLKSFLVAAHRKFYFRPRYLLRRLAAVRSVSELAGYSRIAFKMMFDVVAYKR